MMKKVLFVAAVAMSLVFSGCMKEDDTYKKLKPVQPGLNIYTGAMNQNIVSMQQANFGLRLAMLVAEADKQQKTIDEVTVGSSNTLLKRQLLGNAKVETTANGYKITFDADYADLDTYVRKGTLLINTNETALLKDATESKPWTVTFEDKLTMCGAELNGGYQMTAIGTFCHEFGHVLGWPDFYDTDYSASGGTAPALENFSLMCSGSYNNNSRTPPSVNILERWMVGWAEPDEVTENGLYTLAPVSENKGYLVQTPTTNDYFLLENRDTRNNKWDQPLNSAAACRGLLVYHVDYTSRYAPQWSYNTLNNNPAHECMKLVRSVPGRSSYDVPEKTFFPGANNITSLSPETNADYISWNSGKPSVSFSDIKLDGSQVRLSVKTKANLKAEVSARQYDALLTWEGDPAAEWEITWKSAGIQRSETVTGCNAFHITGLSPATEYALSIAQVSDTVDSSKDLIFNTEPTYTYKSVRICIPDEGYTHDTPVMLSLLDYRGKIGRIDWYIDNRKTENTYTTLAAGEHTIMAVVTDAEEESQQYIVKYITVK